ncbi:MAG: hypothetical protein WCO25_05085 [Candidatus Uhrbacteria bacterium]
MFFDKETWDGTDLFIPEGTAMVVVSEPVKLAIEKAKLTNVECNRLSDRENTSLPTIFPAE